LTRTTTCNSLLGALLSNVLDLRSNLKLGGDLDYELTREGGGGSPEEAAGSPRWGGGGRGLPKQGTRDDLNLELCASTPPCVGLCFFARRLWSSSSAPALDRGGTHTHIEREREHEE
jgi:hypothetical protein